MSVYTVQGNPVMHNGQFLSPGGTHDLPDYDAGDANKVLKVNPSGLDIGWYDDADTTYTAGNGLTLSGTEFSVDTSVVATQSDLSDKQDTLTAGQNITIENNVISATGGGATYTAGNGIDITGDEISVDTSVVATQSDLSGKQDTLTAGTNIQINGTTISATDTTYTAGTGIDITGTTISADTTVLATQNDLSTGLASKQDELTAGSNIQINGTTISATDTTYTAGSGLTLTGTEFSADTTVLATQQDLSGKQDTLTAGSNITIQNNVISATDTTYSAGTGIDITSGVISADTTVLATQNDLSTGLASKQDELTAGSNIQINGTTISATDTTYSAGTGIDITGTTISADTSVLATQTDLSGKQDALTAGANVQINNNVISATDTTYTAGSGLTLTGTEFSADTTVLATQNDLSGKQDTLTAGSNISIQNNVISATAAPQVQSDWAETDTTDVSYIQNKPTEKTLAAGSNVTITEANDTVTISATDTTYMAGTGIDISNNEISVETPVDIVAGPGIVIDNPDGNTLRVSMAQDYETLLWSGTETATMNLSEPITNFETIKLIGHSTEKPGAKQIQLIDSSSTEFMFVITGLYDDSGVNRIVMWGSNFSITNNGNSIAYTLKGHTWQQASSWSNGGRYVIIDKVIGIHRIANN